MEAVVSIFTDFVTAFGALSTAILASALFLLPVGIKFTGRAIGFAKSLMGTKGGRKGR